MNDSRMSRSARLVAIMARMRGPPSTGGRGNRADLATIEPYTIEEAYEVADAIRAWGEPRAKGTNSALCSQVVFPARMAEGKAGWFAFADVVPRRSQTRDAAAIRSLR